MHLALLGLGVVAPEQLLETTEHARRVGRSERLRN
jgi:hypothetical protein